jgi:tRNA(Ile)-lysidine synthase
MLEKFLAYIAEKSLIDKQQKILLGVSGGIDSSVMTDLFAGTSFQFALAHCNFKLRGIESDEDQEFVRQIAGKYKVPFYTIEFNTLEYSHHHGVSIQMAARDLRYQWFNSVIEKNGFDRIAIAHNRDDIGETMLLNLVRGTGLRGLTGIKPQQGKIIRPLLFASRIEIEEYAIDRKVSYREDSSNSESRYHRNLIRNEIIPLMKRINPAIIDTLYLEADIFESSYSLYKNELELIRNAITLENGDQCKLSIPKILALGINQPVLFDILSPFGFNFSDVIDIHRSLNAAPGKRFLSKDYILLKDRNTLLIEKKHSPDNTEYLIEAENDSIALPLQLTFYKTTKSSEFRIPKGTETIALDADKVKYPLKIRKWHEGDWFIPLGLKGRKKLSDFFTDRKLSLFDKSEVWILLSGEDIIWIIGYQIDDRFKIEHKTKNALVISLKT